MWELEKKFKKLKEFASKFERVVLAFSGGVDSATLAALCKYETEVLAVTFKTQVTPSRELNQALKLAKEIGLKHEVIELDILSPEFRRNPFERCYLCKKKMIEELLKIAERRGCDAVFEGTNYSDLEEYRPGYKAIKEFEKVYSPWVEFGFSKDEIRRIAEKLNLSVANSPSLSCIATRIPFGIEITEEVLKMIDEAENFVIDLCKVENVRVRNVNSLAIIEVPKGLEEKVFEKREKIVEKFKEIGFEAIFLDLEGYKSGKATLWNFLK
ncbi:MAG: ATP-dependent sacrificial sulfur transferase LarE [Archaeoglobales archaeon]|nr:ATP-dependent sacrificial sulfur transferase LarE [Archaeoglobales archaeon]